jgi:endo-1,3(4)-beta-glucanase
VNTRWATDWSAPQWISLDLGVSYTLTGAKINWETASAKAYKIQVSTDNVNWNDAYVQTAGAGGVENITFTAPITGRYIRLNATVMNTAWGCSVYEFQVYGN